MLHLEDIVEELATKRRGKIDNTGGMAGEPPNLWRVYFSDGQEPLMKYFKNEEDLRLIKCPHGESAEAGFVPQRPLMEP